MHRGRSSQTGVIQEKYVVSEVGKYEEIEAEERFRYASGMGKGSFIVAVTVLGTEKEP